MGWLGFLLGLLGGPGSRHLLGLSGAAPPPQSTLVTRSMTERPGGGVCLPAEVCLSPSPLMRLLSSAEARSTTPCAEMLIAHSSLITNHRSLFSLLVDHCSCSSPHDDGDCLGRASYPGRGRLFADGVVATGHRRRLNGARCRLDAPRR